MGRAQAAAKRTLDMAASGAGLVLLSPLLLALYVAVRVTSPGSGLFGQWRLGRGGKQFRMWKFRSMRVGAAALERRDSEGATIQTPDDPRVTPLGRVLRKYSLDELPQLWNVFVGDMSLVGPRPDLPDVIGLYDETERRRLLVRPGITGLAIVNGRNGIPWRERLRWDVTYVDRFSLLLDLRILIATAGIVVFGRGTYTLPDSGR